MKITCPCGKEFSVSPSRYANGRRKYCCLGCRYKYHNMRVKHNFEKSHLTWFKKGHLPWNTGKIDVTVGRKKGSGKGYLNYQGYRIKEEVLEHRLILEKQLGRKLQSDEVVHHIDGNKKNNNINNLVVMSRSEHTELHHKKRRELCVSL